MKKFYCRFVKTVNLIYKYLAIFLLAVISVALFLQVFTRFVLNSSLLGSEELALYLFIWMSMLGGSLCVANSSHSVVSMLNDALSPKWKNIHNLVIDIIILIFSLLLVFKGVEMAQVAVGQRTPAVHIPKPLIYSSLVAAGFGMTLNSIRNIITMRDCGEEVEK